MRDDFVRRAAERGNVHRNRRRRAPGGSARASDDSASGAKRVEPAGRADECAAAPVDTRDRTCATSSGNELRERRRRAEFGKTGVGLRRRRRGVEHVEPDLQRDLSGSARSACTSAARASRTVAGEKSGERRARCATDASTRGRVLGERLDVKANVARIDGEVNRAAVSGDRLFCNGIAGRAATGVRRIVSATSAARPFSFIV